jgi:peptide/nickel transport system permease protein
VSAGAPELLTGTEDALTIEAEGSEREITARSPMQLFWRRLRRDKVAMVALGFVILIVLVAVLAPLLVRIVGTPAPNVTNADLTDDFGQPLGPMAGHPFGVDKLGRDVFSRTVYGARVSLEVAFIATALTVLIGVSVGLVAGYYRGWADTLLTRSMDLLLAFPVLVLAIGIGVACSGRDGCAGGLIKPGLTVVIFVITLTTWPYMARIVRGQVLSLREKEFVEAAQSLGASDRRILFREILPNLIAPIIVYSTILIPQNILYEAALSFLGVGVRPPTASWGGMLSDAVVYYTTPHFMLWPGLAIFATVLAFNLFGDGLRDAFDPKTR